MLQLMNFDLLIEPSGGGFTTRVVASPAGEAVANFALPFSEKDLEILVLRIGTSVGRARRKVRRLKSDERQMLEDFGGQLFHAVFSGIVHDCLRRSRQIADSKGGGLRIRLRLPPELVNIPWEYLYDEEYGFLSLSPETTLVRYTDLPTPVRPFSFSPPLRILAMISAPSDMPRLEAEEEWDKLNDTLGGLVRRGLVEVDRLQTGTLAALQRPLRLSEYHVLHFIGHGGYDENAQNGALALEDVGGRTRLVTGRDLGLMIRGHRSLRLVVLNACEGARGAKDDPFGGVAQALVGQGIPAVIAMQFEISDSAALMFGQSFYEAIADGLPVDVATVETRRAMFAEGNEVEWATPVLHLRSPDGRVFSRGRAVVGEHQARENTQRQAEEDTAPPVLGDRTRGRGIGDVEDVPGFSSRGIFLSYRREDTAPYARLLQRELTERFPDAQVFMDLDSIEAGRDFADFIQDAVNSCAVLVALIGPQWATLVDEEGERRLDNPDDFVRFEVQAALERGVRVIPVLVDGAKPLRKEQLPTELHKLARLGAKELSHRRYESDVNRLIDLIREVIAKEPDVASVAAADPTTLKTREQRQYVKRETRTEQENGEQIRREAVAAAPSVADAQGQQETKAQDSQQQAKIFLCYRREDTQGFARGIYESLAGKYGRDQVFRDIDSTPAGVRFATWIESRVGQCSVMIVLIGNTWSSAKDPAGQRRLDLPKDWVRHEIEAALRRDIPIIPVRVQGAPMPSENELPSTITDLTGFQSAEVTDSRWDYDVQLLTQAIDDLITSD